jgi:hypothetical protein
MSKQLKYDEVEDYLRTFSTNEPPYDFNGLFHLITAGLENLRKNSSDQDLIDYAWTLTNEQVRFLRKLLDSRPQSIAKQANDK